jgi:hypothetical protein
MNNEFVCELHGNDPCAYNLKYDKSHDSLKLIFTKEKNKIGSLSIPGDLIFETELGEYQTWYHFPHNSLLLTLPRITVFDDIQDD